jgi:hypothetical protein
MMPPRHDPFFVGYFRKVAPEIMRFSLAIGVTMVLLLAVMAMLLPLGAADPGSGRYDTDLREGDLSGVIEPLPYPILRVSAAHGDAARAILLGGQGKVGAQQQADAVGGGQVELGGVFLRRGDLEMLLVTRSGEANVQQAGVPFVPQPAQDLGRWRLTGEICDGKCYSGAMKPGTGLAHKACANLCILGGLPPVLVMALPVAGRSVVLLAGEDGGPVRASLLDFTGVPVTLEGHLEQRDDLLVYRVDDAWMRPL